MSEQVSGAYTPRNEPVSQEFPTDTENSYTISLYKYLNDEKSFESEELVAKRQEVLQKLDYLVKQFVRKVYLRNNNDQTGADQVNGKLFTYGSYRLGVSNPLSDIDTLCVAPRFVKREDFFNVFGEMLANNNLVKDLVKVEDALVPIMKMKFQDILIDMSFAQLELGSIDDNINLEEDAILADVDTATANSLNGVRVNEMILKLTKQGQNFQTMLRFIRIWAHRRAIYGNVYGYLGGINCALLCAWTCQRYPNATASTLIHMMFNDLKDWTWPDPIYINTPNTGTKPSWDNSPGSKGKKDFMPIITPAYPCINSLQSATKSTRERMTKEFGRAAKLAMKVMTEGYEWKEIVKPSNFFLQYKKYIQINAWTTVQESFKKWIGTVESRIRKFTQALETVSRFIQSAVAYPDHFDHEDFDGHEYVGSFFIGITYSIPQEESIERIIDISEPAQAFLDQMLDPNFKGHQPDMFLEVKLVSRNMIPDFVFPDGIRPALKIPVKKNV